MGKSSPNLAYWTLIQTGRLTPLAVGKPGMAKSKSAEAFARATGRQIYTLIGSLREPSDIGGYPHPMTVEVVDPVTGKKVVTYMAIMPPKYVVDCMEGDWFLFLDELTTCPPAVQAAMLGIIAEGRVGDEMLPANVWKGAACNPPGCAANGYDLEPPMANRVGHFVWEFDAQAWERGMANGGVRFPSPQFEILPQDWERHMASGCARVASFHRHLPGLIDASPDPNDPDYRVKASNAYPSPRSWHNAGIGIAALEAIDADPGIRYQTVRAYVGDEAGLQYQKWEEALDLPDPEPMIVAAIEARKAGLPVEAKIPARSDKAMCTLAGIINRACNHHKHNGKPDGERWLAAGDILNVARKNHMEYVVATILPLLTNKPNGAVLPAELTEAVYPVLARTGMLKGPGC
jgi:hypothetical protein